MVFDSSDDRRFKKLGRSDILIILPSYLDIMQPQAKQSDMSGVLNLCYCFCSVEHVVYYLGFLLRPQVCVAKLRVKLCAAKRMYLNLAASFTCCCCCYYCCCWYCCGCCCFVIVVVVVIVVFVIVVVVVVVVVIVVVVTAALAI